MERLSGGGFERTSFEEYAEHSLTHDDVHYDHDKVHEQVVGAMIDAIPASWYDDHAFDPAVVDHIARIGLVHTDLCVTAANGTGLDHGLHA